MKLPAGLVVALVAGGVAHAQPPERDDVILSCKATHAIACSGTGCEAEAGDSHHVVVGIDTRSGSGNLCTFTYCRDFRLMPEPGEGVQAAVNRLTGFTLSGASGSTEEHMDRPAIDYQLSIADDRKSFSLFGAGNGGISGWSGVCEARAR